MKKLILIVAVLSIATVSFGHKIGKGLYELRPFGDTESALKNALGWTSFSTAGVALRVSWSDLEGNGLNQFKWDYIDDAQSLAAFWGKKWSLVIGCGEDAPSWIYSGTTNGVGVDLQTFQVTLPPPTGVICVPAPWDTNYQSVLQSMVHAIAQRYDSDPNFLYVVMSGVGYLDSCSLCKADADNTELTNLGGVSLWINAFQNIAAIYVSEFQKTNVVVNFYNPTYASTPQGVQNAQTDAVTAVNQFLSNGAPPRWGIKWNNLTGGDPTVQQTPLALIDQIGGTYFTGFQIESPSTDYASAYSVYSDSPAYIFEVYDADLQ